MTVAHIFLGVDACYIGGGCKVGGGANDSLVIESPLATDRTLFHATEKTDKGIFMGERCSSVNLIYRQKMKLETLKQNRKQRNELTSAVSC